MAAASAIMVLTLTTGTSSLRSGGEASVSRYTERPLGSNHWHNCTNSPYTHGNRYKTNHLSRPYNVTWAAAHEI